MRVHWCPEGVFSLFEYVSLPLMYSGPFLPSLLSLLELDHLGAEPSTAGSAWALGFECGLCSHACALSCWALAVGKWQRAPGTRDDFHPNQASSSDYDCPALAPCWRWMSKCLHSSGLLCWAGSQRYSAAVKSSGGACSPCVSPCLSLLVWAGSSSASGI